MRISAGVRRVVAALSLTLFAAVVTAPPALAAAATDPVSVQVEQGPASADQAVRGQGLWTCLLCAVGAGAVIAGGIGGIATFLAAPGSEAIIAVCAIECYELINAE